MGIIGVAYYCGGYVAGRTARFNGIIQGVAVRVWTVVIAVVVLIGAVLGGLAGMHYHRRVDRAVPIAGVTHR